MKSRYFPLAIAFLFFFVNDIISQNPCLPAPNGELAGNEAPGCLLCAPIYSGRNEGYSATAPGSAGFPCGTVENNFFLSIIVGSSGRITGTVGATDCVQNQGIQLIIFDQNFNPVSNCFAAINSQNQPNLEAENLTPGDTYWIMVDGFAGDVCDVLLTFSGGIFSSELGAVSDILQTPSDGVALVGSEVCFLIPTVDNATIYDWQIPSGAVITTQPSDKEICLRFTEEACQEISVDIRNNCYVETVTSTPISVKFELPQVNQYQICNGGQVNIGGTIFDSPSSGSITLENGDQFGCDSLIIYEVSEVNFLEIAAIPSDSLPCSGDCVPIEFDILSAGNFNYQWSSQNGSFGASTTGSPMTQACFPGIYQLEILDQNQNSLCFSEIQVDGYSGISKEPKPIGWPTQACAPGSFIYQVEEPDIPSTAIWSINGGNIITTGTNQVEVTWKSDVTEGEVCVQFGNACGLGEEFCESITIRPEPTSDFSFDLTVCEGDNVRVNYLGSRMTGNIYDWDFGNLQIISGSDEGPYDLTPSSAGQFPIILTVSNGDCTSEPNRQVLRVDNRVSPVTLDCFADWDSLVFVMSGMPDPGNISFSSPTNQIGKLVDSLIIFNNLSPLEDVNLRVFAEGEFGACPLRQTAKTCRSLPCPELNIEYPTTPIYLCPGDTGEFTVAPVLSITTNPIFDGAGDYEIISDFLTPELTFKAEDIPVGRSEFTIHYEENYCVYDVPQAIERIDTTPVIAECFPDTFLTSVAVRWNQTQADEYDVLLNGVIVKTVSLTSTLVPVDGFGSDVNITIQPTDISGCQFPPTTITCQTPNVVSVFEKNIADDFKIIPNPSSGIFNIESDFKIEKIEVFAPSGKKVLEKNSEQIDLTGFPKGVYFFKIKSKDFTLTKRGILF